MESPAASATHFSELKNKIEQRQAKIGIIGLGYVGLPLALLYSEQDFPVTVQLMDSSFPTNVVTMPMTITIHNSP